MGMRFMPAHFEGKTPSPHVDLEGICFMKTFLVFMKLLQELRKNTNFV